MQSKVADIKFERWSSSKGFLAATIGSAVGLGNIWRFPYMAGENGGGTFLIPYFVGIILCGIPLMTFEIAAGRHYRSGIFGTVQAIKPHFWVLGAAIALIGLIFLSYYLVITGWTLGYLISTPLALNTNFDTFSHSWAPLLYFLVAASIAVLIVWLGVSKGIERASKVLLPLLIIILVLIAAYGLTLSGRAEAVSFLFRPQLSELLSPQVWANGFGQAFFSLGVGLGVLVTYGSYLDDDTNITGSSLVVSSADTIVALVAGLAIFPIVFSFGQSPTSGPQLAFQTLPVIFKQMPLGSVVGTSFYLLLFLAATTSAVSLLEMVVRSVSDRLSWSHVKSLIWTVVPILVLGTLSALSYSPIRLGIMGRPVLDLLDTAMGTFGLLLGGLLTSVALFWMCPPETLIGQLDGERSGSIGRLGFFLGKFVLPVALIFILVAYTLDLL